MPVLTSPAAAASPPQVIAGEVLNFLREGGDEVARGDAVRSLCDLAERFAPDHAWFVDTMNQLFEAAGAGREW
jgi:AP-4 complex subunit epsilon-1